MQGILQRDMAHGILPRDIAHGILPDFTNFSIPYIVIAFNIAVYYAVFVLLVYTYRKAVLCPL